LLFLLIYINKVDYTTYCGYVDYLMVIIFIVCIFLLILIRVLIRLFLRRFSVIIFRLKLVNVGFFGDIELIISL